MNTTLQSRAGSFFCVKPLEKSIKQLQDHLEKVENSITNNLQLNQPILTSYEKVMVFERWEKLREKFWFKDFQFFFLEWMGRN